MPRSQKGHQYILCTVDEMTNYLVTVPLYQARSKEVGIMDQDSAFMSSLIKYLFRKLGVKIKTVGPYNYQSLQAEHSIKSLSNIFTNT